MGEKHSEESELSQMPRLTVQFRLLGILPLGFFLAQAAHYWEISQLGHLLWMCNIGNVVLALGLFLEQPVLIRVAVLWSVPGVFVWLRYVVSEWFHLSAVDWGAVLASTFAHLGGAIVGILALRKVRMDRVAWLYSFAWYLVLQLVSRLGTAADLNVNVSHSVYEGWQQLFTAYWKFWLLMTIVVATGLWLSGLALNKLWPSRPVGS